VKIVIDSYAWIEHFLGSEKGRKVDEVLENADEIYTPDIVLAEIARKYLREGVQTRIVNSRLEEITEASTIICIDSKLALAASECYSKMAEYARKCQLSRPSLFDALVLATAKSLEAKVVTGDQHFKDMPETIWLEQ